MASATRAARSAYRRKVCNSKVDRMEAGVEGLIVIRLCSGGRRRCPRGCIVAQAGCIRRQSTRRDTRVAHFIGSLAHCTLNPGTGCSSLLKCRKPFEVLRSCFKFDKQRGTLWAVVGGCESEFAPGQRANAHYCCIWAGCSATDLLATGFGLPAFVAYITL